MILEVFPPKPRSDNHWRRSLSIVNPSVLEFTVFILKSYRQFMLQYLGVQTCLSSYFAVILFRIGFETGIRRMTALVIDNV